MASSPTHSSASSSYQPFATPSLDFSGLPVMGMKDKIVEKILDNRVTLIVGETGCGKSSQIPQFLLEKNVEPVLCTQPRRFAVVAVTQMVARARNCEVGGEVGYHIGHSKAYSARSKIVFKTAGVLLDEMRDKGLNALKYKVIVLDEVHERSVESDMVLVCIKQFLLKKKDLRVVLMSATADISRYREYFKDLGRGERVEVLGIPSTGKNALFQKKVLYLGQVTELLGMDCDDLSSTYCSGPSPRVASAEFKPEVHQLIHDLVLHIHRTEPDIEKSILVFLPTYQSLEKQWSLMQRFSGDFKVHILHRSVDTDQALKAMKIWKSHRKVILATNMAESSVTIPKVGYVIDSCRSLQVFWDSNRKSDKAELVWVSKSQAEQRRGRTGRTCDGQVYRLVPEVFYGLLDDYESPALLNLSLRKQTLLLCCAESKVINEPKALFQKSMDPPDPDTIQDALDLLIQINALEKTSYRGRHAPTFYGRILASLSLSFDASLFILKFGDIGMLREGIIFGVMLDLQPLPILRPFGQDSVSVRYTDSYYHGNSKIAGLGSMEVPYVANFCAFQFWQRAFKDKCRYVRLENINNLSEQKDSKLLLRKMEEEWCSFHDLILPSLEQVVEAYDEIINSLHRFRPKCLVISNSIPVYYEPSGFRHDCCLMSMEKKNADTLLLEDDESQYKNEATKCVSVPFVGPYDFGMDDLARRFASTVKEMRIQLAVDVSTNQNRYAIDHELQAATSAPLCRYFANGLCNRGDQCPFSHSLLAKKPACNFFFSLKGCRNGDSCFFSHDVDPVAISRSESSLCFPDDEDADTESLLQFFPVSARGYVLITDDIDFHFSSILVRLCDPACIIATTSQTDPLILDPRLDGMEILSGLSHPYQTIMSKRGENKVPWEKVKCVLWFSRSEYEYGEGEHSLVQTFFSYLAIRILAESLEEVRVILTMNNIRFSQLEVEKLARESFFFLTESFPFDETNFGKLFDEVETRVSMAVSMPICYVFDLHPPSGWGFGDV